MFAMDAMRTAEPPGESLLKGGCVPHWTDLARQFGTPLYCYDAEQIRRSLAEFRAAFSFAPLEIHYAIVCNKNRYLVRLLHQLGVGIHANTPGDAFAALAAGIPAERIVYSGTNLDGADFDFLLRNRIAMNLDSLSQLRDLARVGVPTGVGLRLLIDPINRPNRIGVTQAELPEAVSISAAAGFRLTGLHMYSGTNTRKVARFVECFDQMAEASELLPDLEYLDLGGGYGVGYREEEPGLDLAGVGEAVSRRMEALSHRRGRSIRLVLEPGRTLVNGAGQLLIRVVSVKERGGRRFVGVDSTVGNIVVESVYHSYHRIEAVEPRGDRWEMPTDICGNTTHSRDFLGRDCRLPEVRPGDLLLMHDVGAYGYAMSSHFLNRPRPAEVVLDGGEVHLTTRRESLADLLGTQVDP
jgi:diaminopimelate decarboxylase